MSPTLCSQGAVVATAMAVSGTFILLALRLQKSIPVAAQFPVQHRPPIAHQQSRSLRSCISSDGKKSEKKNKKVRFADDVVEPRGNGDEFRKHCEAIAAAKMNVSSESSPSSSPQRCGDVSPPARERGMPENRRALYSAILRDRGVQRLTYSC
ncbi:unnamed protein product [Linum tenue]|uniref:Uncharacterized protein n=1 Tax=Linum tenue TaxID=586396 RepID=A0AAV0QF09_9ROSI|nr:unnamed protein product [Linum tenue]